MRNGIMHLFLSLEEAATGVANIEVEKVFYAKLLDKSILDTAESSESHEQWELRIAKTTLNASGGRIRIRKTTKAGENPEYVLTSKTRNAEGGELEIANPSSADAFEQFKHLAEKGMIKKRYVFDIPGRPDKWEVDTYLNQDGSLSEWTKIDLEISDGNFEIPSFPEGLLDLQSLISNDQKSHESEALIRSLYDKVFITKNEYL